MPAAVRHVRTGELACHHCFVPEGRRSWRESRPGCCRSIWATTRGRGIRRTRPGTDLLSAGACLGAGCVAGRPAPVHPRRHAGQGAGGSAAGQGGRDLPAFPPVGRGAEAGRRRCRERRGPFVPDPAFGRVGEVEYDRVVPESGKTDLREPAWPHVRALTGRAAVPAQPRPGRRGKIRQADRDHARPARQPESGLPVPAAPAVEEAIADMPDWPGSEAPWPMRIFATNPRS